MTATECLVHEPDGNIGLQKCVIGPVGPSQCLVETSYSAVSSGTELRCLYGDAPGASYVPGYLGVGRIAGAGSLSKFKQGERVVFWRGTGYRGLSSQWGCHSQRALVDDCQLHHVPVEVSDLDAVFSKIAAIAFHGVNLACIKKGERVLVLGLGLLGQLSARICNHGEAHVLAAGRNPVRVNHATRAGIRAYEVDKRIDEKMKQLFGPEIRADVILDATGNRNVISEALPLANDLLPWENPTTTPTRYVVQGSFRGALSFDYEQAFRKELHFFISRDHNRKDLEEVFAMMTNQELVFSDLIPEPVCPSEAASHYEALRSPNPEAFTAVFDWSKL
ncbi:MAG: hypothetical protein P1U68_08905 [Verrucomicrobiales bacterium]|nr:hypothetical protein [Verrucomicrobiales bacterium]